MLIQVRSQRPLTLPGPAASPHSLNMKNAAYHILFGVSVLVNIVLLAYTSVRDNSQPDAVDQCFRKTLNEPDTVELRLGKKGGICLDYYRNPGIKEEVVPCPTPGSIRVEQGIHLMYSNIALRAMKPNHLCLVDTSHDDDKPIICGRRNEDNTYTEWTIGIPNCEHKWFINGQTGICMHPALRAPSHWLNERYVTLDPAPIDFETASCDSEGVVFSLQNLDGHIGTRFFTTHRGTGVVRHATIAGKNFYIIGNPTRQAILDAIAEHETKDQKSDTVVLPQSLTITNTQNLVKFTCQHSEYTIGE